MVVCCHGDRMLQSLLGNVTTDDVILSSLIYVNLTSLQTYLSVMLELTLVSLNTSLTVSLSLSVCLFVCLLVCLFF